MNIANKWFDFFEEWESEEPVDEGLLGKIFTRKRAKAVSSNEYDEWGEDEWDQQADGGDPNAVEIQGDDPYDGQGPAQFLTRSELKRLEKEYQKQLRKQFKEANPHILKKLKTVMDQRDWWKLVGMLSVGAFWGAAAYSMPWIFLPTGAVVGARYIKNRRDVRKQMGINPRLKFTMDTGYQKGDFSNAVAADRARREVGGYATKGQRRDQARSSKAYMKRMENPKSKSARLNMGLD